MASKTILGGRTITSEEALEFGQSGGRVLVLDDAVAEKIADAVKVAAQTAGSIDGVLTRATESTGAIKLCGATYRCAVLGLAAQLAESRGAFRPEALRAVTAAAAVASEPQGHDGLVALLGQTIKAACGGTILASEVAALEASTGGVASAALVPVATANNFGIIADAVAAVTLEALQVSSGPSAALVVRAALSALAPELNELGRPHAGIAASAGAIRALLEGSRLPLSQAVGPDGLEDAAVAVAVSCAAQLHGAAGGAAQAALRACLIEINSPLNVTLEEAAVAAPTPAAVVAAAAVAAAPAPVPAKTSKAGKTAPALQVVSVIPAHAQVLVTALRTAASASLALARVSLARSAALLPLVHAEESASASADVAAAAAAATAAEAAFSAGAGSFPGVTVPAESVRLAYAALGAMQSAVQASVRAVATEAALGDAVLGRREAAAAHEAADKEAKKAAAASAREAAEAARVAALPEEERLAAEAALAKRRQKEQQRKDKEAAAAAAAGAGAEEEDVATSAAAAAASPAAAAANWLGLGQGVQVPRWLGLGQGVNWLGLGQGVHEWRRYLAALPGGAGAGGAFSAASVARLQDLLGAVSCTSHFEATLSSLADASAAAAAAASATRPDSFLRALVDRLGSGGAKRKAKIAKGARDFAPEQMEIRERCFGIIRGVFKRHGAVEIDTPVFELRETLLGKYGEEGGKLIYDLADQGGEVLSLRYDLTVPFARYIAMHGISNIKRYHMARVYRRDNPAMNKGRYREFYQCDFDIAGVYAPMLPDAEVLSVACGILGSLPIGDFTIKLNHRRLLDAMLELAGVPAAKFRPICSAIDKLDKEPWAAVREEMVAEKGLSAATADRIGAMVQLRGEPRSLLRQLLDQAAVATSPAGAEAADGGVPVLARHAGAASALAELGTLFGYLEAMGCLHRLTFDLSLARGLDYYTGVIYEAVLLDPTVGIGSIAAGGRYDTLVGMFAPAPVPCVGVSVGVERVLAIMEARQQAAAAAAAGGAAQALARTPVSVYVASIPSGRFDMTRERLRVAAELWAAGYSAELSFAADPKLQKQVAAAAEGNVPYMVVLGEDELDKGLLQVKDMAARTAAIVPRAGLLAELARLGARTINHTGHHVDAAPATPAAVVAAVPPESVVGGGDASVSNTPAAAVAVVSVASPAAASAGAGAVDAASVTGSVGVVLEGAARLYGRFSRPAVPI